MWHPPGSAAVDGRRRLRASIAAALSVLAAMLSMTACGRNSAPPAPASQGPPPSGHTIVIKDFAYSPATLTVSPGEKIVVRNEDPTTHTLTAVAPHAGAFNTGDIHPSSTATFTAPSAAGSYPYICEIHQFMHGTLTVR